MSHPRVQTMLLCKSKYPCESEISLENERQEYKVMQGCVGFFFFFFNTVEPQLAATSLQLPRFCVPKVAVVEVFAKPSFILFPVIFLRSVGFQANLQLVEQFKNRSVWSSIQTKLHCASVASNKRVWSSTDYCMTAFSFGFCKCCSNGIVS